MIKILVSTAFLVGLTSAYYGNAPSSRYKFEYAVNDPRTQDIKNQWEARDGNNVRGSYSLIDADGTRRVVDYTADGHNGFNAIVRREGHGLHGHPRESYHGYSGYSEPNYYQGGHYYRR